MEVVEHRFRVMASAAHVLLVDPEPDAIVWAELRLRALEERWSRFIATSDITTINRHPDSWVPVSSDTIDLIRTMQEASRVTDGAYDPTFLHRLITAGYSSSIDDPDRITIAVDSPCLTHSVHDVAIAESTSMVRAPAGLSLDPGGIGKGFAADLVASALVANGTGGALVSLGGDMAAAGMAPTADGWHVHIEDPHEPARIRATLGVSGGGVATSSTLSRRWRHDGVEQHHVIDPATGVASTTDLATVTVVANAGWLAEAHATAALLAGSARAIGWLDAHGLSGVAIDRDGDLSATSDLIDTFAPMNGVTA